MIYLINDTAVEIRGGKALAVSQGGSSSFVAGLINSMIAGQMKFALIGNFNVSTDNVAVFCYKIISRRNPGFLTGLIKVFLFKKFSKHDILYFHRPDHVALSIVHPSKKVLHIHGPVSETIRNKRRFLPRMVFSILESLAMKIADLIFITDPKTSELYCQKYPAIRKKIQVVPSGVDYSFFAFPEDSHYPMNLTSGKGLIYAGRLTYPKRLMDIINSFKIAQEVLPDLTLHIAGDGPEIRDLQKFVQDKGLVNRVIFHGTLDKKSLRSLIYSCDAGILLSHFEGSPISIKEILACGKPVIVNDVGDVKNYVIHEKTGFVVNPENPAEVVDAIVKAITLSAEMADDCREMVRKYDQMIINQEILRTITGISGSN